LIIVLVLVIAGLGLARIGHRLAQPYRCFENIWSYIIEQQAGVLLVAVYQGNIIRGVLFLEWKDGLYYNFNASAPTHLSLRPNDLLIWEGIQYGRVKGYTHLDFGLSDWDQEGLVRYKRKFASEEKTIFFLRYFSDGGPT
jgi:lipid II:glycine glycyltransferase (peptidoglycan interpeptide bridge formation enzyme)